MSRLSCPTASWLVLTASLICFGCAQERGPDYRELQMARVSGTITLDGEPVEGARVEFVESERRPPRLCFGTTDSEGYYQIYRDRNVPGCLHGQMIVKITGGEQPEEVGDENPGRVPSKYGRGSRLLRTVEPNGSHTFDFELQSSP